MQNIIFHSDDYGMTVASSKYILDCCDHGVLNSVAILSNSPCLSQCSQLLTPYIQQDKIQLSVHLNLVEGRALSSPQDLPLLTDKHGFFRHSFEQLLLLSFSPKRNQLKKEIKQELSAQIEKVQELFPSVPLALDSHQHFHMIPLVFHAVMEIIKESALSVRYVRLSSEPLLPFLRTPSLYRQIKPINIVKNILLNILGWRDASLLNAYGIPTNVFWGLMFSGDMNLTVVETLLPKFLAIAEKKGLPLEILSHPCPVNDLSDCMDPKKKDFVNFYFSKGRLDEAHMLQSIQLSSLQETS